MIPSSAIQQIQRNIYVLLCFSAAIWCKTITRCFTKKHPLWCHYACIYTEYWTALHLSIVKKTTDGQNTSCLVLILVFLHTPFCKLNGINYMAGLSLVHKSLHSAAIGSLGFFLNLPYYCSGALQSAWQFCLSHVRIFSGFSNSAQFYGYRLETVFHLMQCLLFIRCLPFPFTKQSVAYLQS